MELNGIPVHALIKNTLCPHGLTYPICLLPFKYVQYNFSSPTRRRAAYQYIKKKKGLETQGTTRFYYGKNLDKKNHALQKEPNHLLNKGRKA